MSAVAAVPWLLVLDNVDDARIIASFLPPAGRLGSIILTARSTNPQFTPATKRQVIDPLTHEDSCSLLSSQLAFSDGGFQATEADAEILGRICSETGGLPLAILQVAGFIMATGCDLSEALNEFSEALLQPGEYDRADPYYDSTLANVWDVTFARFQSQSGMVELLNVIAFLDPDSISEKLLDLSGTELSAKSGFSFISKRAQ